MLIGTYISGILELTRCGGGRRAGAHKFIKINAPSEIYISQGDTPISIKMHLEIPARWAFAGPDNPLALQADRKTAARL